jgi:hypothetical protein
MRAHTDGNLTAPAAIPARPDDLSPEDLSPGVSQPWRIQDSRGSAPSAADPGGG